jgi:hypothetical protein
MVRNRHIYVIVDEIALAVRSIFYNIYIYYSITNHSFDDLIMFAYYSITSHELNW